MSSPGYTESRKRGGPPRLTLCVRGAVSICRAHADASSKASGGRVENAREIERGERPRRARAPQFVTPSRNLDFGAQFPCREANKKKSPRRCTTSITREDSSRTRSARRPVKNLREPQPPWGPRRERSPFVFHDANIATIAGCSSAVRASTMSHASGGNGTSTTRSSHLCLSTPANINT